MMTLLFLLAVAQDSPEAIFQKIEADFAKADTVRITSKTAAVLSVGGKEMRAVVEGTLMIKGADKVSIRLKVKQDEEPPEEIVFVANGGKMRGPGKALGNAPKDLRKTVLALIPRLGAGIAMQTAVDIGAGRPPTDKPTAPKFTAKLPEKPAHSLSFDVDYDGVTWKTSLVYDEKSLKLLSLEAKVTPTDSKSEWKAGTSRTITETLTVEIGGDIPDKEFDLPKDR